MKIMKNNARQRGKWKSREAFFLPHHSMSDQGSKRRRERAWKEKVKENTTQLPEKQKVIDNNGDMRK